MQPSSGYETDLLLALNRIVKAGYAYARKWMLEPTAQERRAYHGDSRGSLLSRKVDCIAYQRRIETFWTKIDAGEAASLTDRIHSALTKDDAGDNIRAYVEELRKEIEQSAAGAQSQIRSATTAEASRFTQRWTASVQAGANIDVSALVRDDDLVDFLSLRTQEHVRLIRALSEDVAARIERTTLGSVLEGRGNKETADILSEMEGINRNRAALIARDQSAKLNSSMNEYRQRQAGITHFKWIGISDARERDTHRANNNRIFPWDRPPAATGLPGSQINCRCRAAAVLDEEPEDLTPEQQEQPLTDFFLTNLPTIRTVAPTISEQVGSFTAEQIEARFAATTELQSAIAAVHKALSADDIERLLVEIYRQKPSESVLEGLMGNRTQMLLASRRTKAMNAIKARLDLIENLLRHAAADRGLNLDS